ncbi:MAG: hypothetical protein EBW96_02115, partial [Actinobacteria bacterium]|nr:hypothetical protein [Actinomycetota bacterium]
GVDSYTIEWSMRRIGGESVLLPITDTDSMKAIFALFTGNAQMSGEQTSGEQDTSAPARQATAGITAYAGELPFMSVLLDALALRTAADDTSTTIPGARPTQDRLGVFPPNDPSCR